MPVIAVYGRPDCGECQTAKDKAIALLAKYGLGGKVSVQFYDVSKPDGMAQASFHDVADIPAVIISDRGIRVARWDGKVPGDEELRKKIQLVAH